MRCYKVTKSKEYVNLNIEVPSSIYDKYKLICVKTKIPVKNQTIELIDKFVKNFEKKINRGE